MVVCLRWGRVKVGQEPKPISETRSSLFPSFRYFIYNSQRSRRTRMCVHGLPGTLCSRSFRAPATCLPLRATRPACGLDAMRIQNRGDQSREAPLDLLAAADVAHFHAVPLAQDQPCFPERPEVL